MSIAIKVENISKAYQLGEIGTGTLSRDIERWISQIRGKEDPFLKIGETNDRETKGTSDIIWSLKDISFEIKQGDAVGIIGRNGAGKSTLLKILSRVTSPTQGYIKGQGRIASLLEVGTGFHPELTGRENIYLNGAILGMRKNEIKRKFDQIVSFAGVERYIDTPVKRYSSGMYVRLAFSVAAYLDSEILIVDEVLAVGDAEFQKKCLGRMNEASKSEGRTILFVSHNMGAIQSLCKNTIVLKNGAVDFKGNVNDSVDHYLNSDRIGEHAYYINTKVKTESDLLELKIVGENNIQKANFKFNEAVSIIIKFRIDIKHFNTSVIGVRTKDRFGRIVFTSENKINKIVNKAGENIITFTIPASILAPSVYFLNIGFYIPNIEMFNLKEDVLSFNINETGSDMFHYSGQDYGCVFINCEWKALNEKY